MNKTKRVALVFFFLILLLSCFATVSLASDGGKAESASASQTIEDIMAELSDAIPVESGVSLEEESLIENVGLKSFINGIINAVRGEGSDILTFFLMVIGFAILCVVCDAVYYKGSEMQRSAGVGIMVIMSVTIYPKVYSIFNSVRSSLESVTGFFGAAVPVMTAVSAASGSVKTAGIQAMNMNITLGILGAIATKILLPLSFSLLSLALVSSFGDKGALSVGKGIKSLFTFGLGMVTAVSSAAFALQTVIASASDSAALRAARYAAGGLIPVVGSSVSAALSTLAGGIAYAKSTVGTAVIAVIVAVSLAPLVSLLIYRGIFGIALTFLEYVDNPKGVRCFSAYKTAFDAVIAVYVMSTLVCIIQVIIFMKGGTGIS